MNAAVNSACGRFTGAEVEPSTAASWSATLVLVDVTAGAFRAWVSAGLKAEAGAAEEYAGAAVAVAAIGGAVGATAAVETLCGMGRTIAENSMGWRCVGVCADVVWPGDAL